MTVRSQGSCGSLIYSCIYNVCKGFSIYIFADKTHKNITFIVIRGNSLDANVYGSSTVIVSVVWRTHTCIAIVMSYAGTPVLTWIGTAWIQVDLTVCTLERGGEGGREGGREEGREGGGEGGREGEGEIYTQYCNHSQRSQHDIHRCSC